MKVQKFFAFSKKKFVVAVACGGILSLYAPETTKPKLCSAIIKWLDNKPFALDCVAMGDILHVRRDLRKIQYGVQDTKTKQFTGAYLFKGEKRTLHWLAEYEGMCQKEFIEQKSALEKKYLDYKNYSAELELAKVKLEMEHEKRCHEGHENIKRMIKDPEDHDYETTKMQRDLAKELEKELDKKEEEIKNKHFKEKNSYHSELKIITEHYKKQLEELKPCLDAAKLDFVKANEPFETKMEGTNQMHQMLLRLIAEFCLKYRRPYSYLLEWADVGDGEGYDSFQRTMATCKTLDVFIVDLVDFLEALYYSCEKARAEFEAKQKEKMQRK